RRCTRDAAGDAAGRAVAEPLAAVGGAWPSAGEVGAEVSPLGGGSELLQRVTLDLTRTLARERETCADLLEGSLRVAIHSVTHPDDLALAFGELFEQPPRVVAKLARRRLVVGRSRSESSSSNRRASSRSSRDAASSSTPGASWSVTRSTSSLASRSTLESGVSRLTGWRTTSSARRTCSSGTPVRSER